MSNNTQTLAKDIALSEKYITTSTGERVAAVVYYTAAGFTRQQEIWAQQLRGEAKDDG